jgi:hypothetical protein
LSPTLTRMSNEAWALVFMLLVLKIPVVYVCSVVWYAIKAEPEPGVDPHQDTSLWKPWSKPNGSRPRRGGPHGKRGNSRRARAARRGRVGA